MSVTIMNGRLGNQIIRNLATSFVAKKHNLYVDYCNCEFMNNLGINLYCGENRYEHTKVLNNENYYQILNANEFKFNINPNGAFFQTKEITNAIRNYLNENKKLIIEKNFFKNRYEINNDLFLHVRTTDVEELNPGTEYYFEAIEKNNFDNIYLASDNTNSQIVKNIVNKHNNIIILNYNEIKTIMFGSTCKNIILSHGSFSAVIGYLAFFSNIYYPKYSRAKRVWFGDMCSMDKWIEI